MTATSAYAEARRRDEATVKPTPIAKCADLPAAEIVLAPSWEMTLRAIGRHGAAGILSGLVPVVSLRALTSRDLARLDVTKDGLRAFVTLPGQQWLVAHPAYPQQFAADVDAAKAAAAAATQRPVNGSADPGQWLSFELESVLREVIDTDLDGIRYGAQSRLMLLEALGLIKGQYSARVRPTDAGYAYFDPTDFRITRYHRIERAETGHRMTTWRQIDLNEDGVPVRAEHPVFRVGSIEYRALDGDREDATALAAAIASLHGLDSVSGTRFRVKVWVGAPVDGQPADGEWSSPEQAVDDTAHPDAAAASYASPQIRQLAAEHVVDLAHVAGTGVGGRIRKQDVMAAATAVDDDPNASEGLAERLLAAAAAYRLAKAAADPQAHAAAAIELADAMLAVDDVVVAEEDGLDNELGDRALQVLHLEAKRSADPVVAAFCSGLRSMLIALRLGFFVSGRTLNAVATAVVRELEPAEASPAAAGATREKVTAGSDRGARSHR